MTLPATFARQDQRDPTKSNEISSGKGGEALIEPFHKLFPDVARRDVRSEHVRNEGEPGGIPAGEYFFVESYCTNPGCPCERVLIDVWREDWASSHPSATISIPPVLLCIPINRIHASTHRFVRASTPRRPSRCSRKSSLIKSIASASSDIIDWSSRRWAPRPVDMTAACRAGETRGSDRSESSKKPRGAKIGGGDGSDANSWLFPIISISSDQIAAFACLATRLSIIALA